MDELAGFGGKELKISTLINDVYEVGTYEFFLSGNRTTYHYTYTFSGTSLYLDMYRVTPDDGVFAFIWSDILGDNIVHNSTLTNGICDIGGNPPDNLLPFPPHGMPGTTVVEPKPQAYYITVFGKEIDGTYYEDETYLLYEGLGTLISTDLEIYKYPHPGEKLKNFDDKPIGETTNNETTKGTIPVYVYGYYLKDDSGVPTEIHYGMIFNHEHFSE